MTTSRTPLLRKKWPLLALVLAAILALILVIWQLQTSPETNDAYVYADTIDVVPEVSGRIVEMPITFLEREAGQSKLSGGIFTEELSLVTRWGVAKRSGQLFDAAKVAGIRLRAARDKRRRAASGYQQQRPSASSRQKRS